MTREQNDSRETIRWDYAGHGVRTAVCVLCGWCTEKEGASSLNATGRMISKTNWDGLTSAAQRVLTAHRIEK